MKATLLTFSLLIAFLVTGHALDLVTPEATFKDVKVTKVEAEAVRITHSEGTALVDFDFLPPAMQEEYGWTAEKSAARKAAKEAEAKRLEEEQKMIEDTPKRKRMEAAAKRKAEEERLMAEERAKRKIENAAFEAESGTAQKDLIEAAAKARAELDAERARGKGKPGEAPVAEVLKEGEEPEDRSEGPRRSITMPFGTVSDVIGGESSFFQNRKLWIGVGIGLAVVLILFMMPSSAPKKVRRR